MPDELQPVIGASFGATLEKRRGSLSLVEDDRDCVELPDSVSVSRVDVDGDVTVRDGATGRALVTVADVRETTGGSDHRYVQLRVVHFVEESVEAPEASTSVPHVGSHVTVHGGERDVASPRSNSYGGIPTGIARRKH